MGEEIGGQRGASQGTRERGGAALPRLWTGKSWPRTPVHTQHPRHPVHAIEPTALPPQQPSHGLGVDARVFGELLHVQAALLVGLGEHLADVLAKGDQRGGGVRHDGSVPRRLGTGLRGGLTDGSPRTPTDGSESPNPRPRAGSSDSRRYPRIPTEMDSPLGDHFLGSWGGKSFLPESSNGSPCSSETVLTEILGFSGSVVQNGESRNGRPDRFRAEW